VGTGTSQLSTLPVRLSGVRGVGALFLLTLLCLVMGAACRISAAKEPGILYLRLSTNPTTLDPALIVDVTGATIAAKLFNGLVRFDQQLNLQPDLAERWEVSPDGTTYTFHLRPGVHFSNGREVTAQDFKYSFERVLNKATRSPRVWVLDRIQGARTYREGNAPEVTGIRVRDTYCLELRLEKAFGPFLSLLSLTNAAVVPREEVERWGPDFSFHVAGTGPYVLEQWQHGRALRVRANSDYFEGPPRLRGISYRILPEDLTTLVEFETGTLDCIRIPPPELRRYLAHPQWKHQVVEQPGLNIYYLGLNCQKPPLDDVRVRQAITLAIDRQKMRTSVYESRGTLATGPIPPLLLPAGSPPCQGYPYDPEQSRKLLREAGHPQGFSLPVTITNAPETLDLVEVVQHYLQQVGIRVTITQLEWSSFKEAVARGETSAFWLSWWADYPDAENFLYPLFHSANWGAGGNRSFYRNLEVDRLIEQAQEEPDATRRMEEYREAEALVVRDAPAVFFWHQTDYYLCQPWVKNFAPPPLSTSDQGRDIFLAPADSPLPSSP
jgi:ABC-type transport system substrate-binding protein